MQRITVRSGISLITAFIAQRFGHLFAWALTLSILEAQALGPQRGLHGQPVMQSGLEVLFQLLAIIIHDLMGPALGIVPCNCPPEECFLVCPIHVQTPPQVTPADRKLICQWTVLDTLAHSSLQ
eukprot:scaffold647806_cov18-Prasinocladus_malaysianus.AAC.1